ncbi:MAG: signal peptide peptidase SppA [Rickettsiaceae bacterium]|nr:signal peptide peptidase SppA [Rickettsiaceae bacterium]
MNISPDYLIERKRNKSHLARWKLISIGLIGLMILGGGGLLLGKKNINKKSFSTDSEYIASIKIDDMILDDMDRVRRIDSLAKDKDIKAVIVHVNSPGGSVVGSEMLYNSLRKLSVEKPVVVVMESVAASGGYLAALAGDYVIAHNGTITGSIGVIMQTPEITKLAEKLGIKFNSFKSGELKANPNPMEELTEEAREATMDSIHDVYNYFIEIVAKRRKLKPKDVKILADGRIYSGRQALKLKLIDAIGDEDTAIEWLWKNKGISENIEVVDVRLKKREKLLDILLEDLQGSISSFFTTSFKGLKSMI